MSKGTQMTSTHRNSNNHNSDDLLTDPSDWLRSLDDVDAALDDMRNELNDAQASSTNAGVGNRVKRTITRKLAETGTSIARLQRSIAAVEMNSSKFKIGDGELSRRKGLLASALSLHSAIDSQLSTNSGRLPSNILSRSSMAAESEASAQQSNVQLHAQQQAALSAQDSKLDGILDGVTRLKVLSGDINTELDLHAHLLDELDTAVEKTDARLQRNTKRVEIVSEQSGGCCGLIIMVILLALIVMLLVTNWACHIFNKEKC